ncbi:hypothetical protein [Microbacterium sp. MMO-113]|uniref:hypothetical protein n=1 Tax=Microbacterium sp. MMO-113 TaxID=3081273 RepID=UPI0030175C3C
MSDMDQAVSVTTSVDIDWEELGRVFADQVSTDQARFFIGFYEAVVDEQLIFIADEKAFDLHDIRHDVSVLISNLGHFIATREARS